MISDDPKFSAGLIHVMAKALQRHAPDHIAIWQAAAWLREQGFDRQAQQLSSAEDSIVEPTNSK